MRDNHSEFAPIGNILVLWSDGKIEEVPLTDRMMQSTRANESIYSFKGQAGLSPQAIDWKTSVEKGNFSKIVFEPPTDEEAKSRSGDTPSRPMEYVFPATMAAILLGSGLIWLRQGRGS